MKFGKMFLILIGVLVALALVGLAVFYFTFPSRESKFNKYYEKRMKIVEMVQAGVLKPDSNGSVDLPDGYKELAVFGKIGVMGKADKLRIEFQLSKKKDDFDLFVYSKDSEEPLVKDRFGRVLPIHKMQEYWFYADSMEIYAEKN